MRACPISVECLFAMPLRPGAAPLKLAAPEQVFDVLPIRGYLQPGEEEIVEVGTDG